MEALVLAVRQASLDSHGVRKVTSSSHGTVADTVRTTADVIPSSDVTVVNCCSSDCCYRAVGVMGWSLARSPVDRIAARKRRQIAGDSLTDLGCDNTCFALSSGEKVEHVAIRRKATISSAVIGGILKSFNIPAIDEVAMESVSSRVTLSKDKWLLSSVPPLKLSSRVNDLVEERNHVDRVGSRAWTVVVGVHCGVSHVRCVIRRVEVYTIPARREEHLGAKTVRAGLVRQSIVVAGGATVIEANETNGLAGKVVGVCALERISCNHTEALRESGEIIVVGATSLTIVRVSTCVRLGKLVQLLTDSTLSFRRRHPRRHQLEEHQ